MSACGECGKRVGAGVAYCGPDCRAVHAARQRARYHARKAAGVCAAEGCRRKPRPGGAYCRGCTPVKNVYTKFAKRKARGGSVVPGPVRREGPED